MVSRTDIEWTKATWNPLQGCKKVSPGCEFCYIFPIIKRFGESWGRPADDAGTVRMAPHKLLEPLRHSKSLDIFTNSMSDLFQQGVADAYIHAVCRVMELANWHRYQVLTKRPHRLRKLLNGDLRRFASCQNIWWGVSVDNRRQGLPRIDELRDTPAVVKFLSVEPLLEDLGEINLDGIHWVIAGGEAGPGARPMEQSWVESIRDQCLAANIPFFFKQWGGVRKKKHGRLLGNRTWDELPQIVHAPVPNTKQRKDLIAQYEREYGHLGLHRAKMSRSVAKGAATKPALEAREESSPPVAIAANQSHPTKPTPDVVPVAKPSVAVVPIEDVPFVAVLPTPDEPTVEPTINWRTSTTPPPVRVVASEGEREMIFQRTWQLVIAGRKTQTRRKVEGRTQSWRVGQSYAVQPGRGQSAIARIVVTAVRHERLGDMTEADAIAEGYESIAEFASVWESMHGVYDPSTEVFVIEFELDRSTT